MILRRLYLYLVSAAALGLLTAGLIVFGITALLFPFNDPSAQDSRGTLATSAAMGIVALPVWAIHFWFARRFAMRDPFERASAIRRLYVYWACLFASVGAMIAITIAAGDLLRPVVDSCPRPTGYFVYCPATRDWLATSQAAWAALVFAVVWAAHFWIASRDRSAAGEEGASATLRRWYMYPALLVGLLTMLAGASQAGAIVWIRIVGSHLANSQPLGDALGLTIGGALFWGFHARMISGNHLPDDRHSTLRALEGFIAVAVSMVIALSGAAQILYYVLARLLGVSSPGGVSSSDILGAVASPASQAVVYAAAWVLVRRRLDRDAGTQEADRQAAIRRLYTNLASLVSLAAWAAGAGGLLWTLAEQIEAPLIGVKAANWRDPMSLWVTLLVVGAAVWVAHWRQAPWAADRQSFSRRLYVWAALLGSVLAVLGGGVGMINAVTRQMFSASPRMNDPANLDFGHFLAVIVVAAGIAAYHWRVLRADAAARPPRTAVPPPPTGPVAAVVPAAAPPATVPAMAEHSAEASASTARKHRYTLEVSDATEDDIHQALAALPPQASYHLAPADEEATHPMGASGP